MSPGRSIRSHLRFAWLRLLIASACFPSLEAATFHVDPATGSMSNPGTAEQPWSTLEAVFTANKTFSAGDVILLESGFHGSPQVKGNNAGNVSILPEEGARPKLKSLVVRSGSRWVIGGLDICPENAGAGVYFDGSLVDIQSSASDITLQDCTIKAALDVGGWSVADWQDRAASAILAAAPRTTISGNAIQNVGYGIRVRKTAANSLVSRNAIMAFYLDGMVGLGDDCTFEYNTVIGSYVDDTNHDDFFQGWSTGSDGKVGTGTIYRVTLRGNTFISRNDPAQPLSTEPQGIGCFDGVFDGWVIENNLIVTNTYHGISLYGAVNCRIVNNTVVENPLDTTTGKRPWIQIYQHKSYTAGGSFPPASSGNLIRNNVSASTAIMVSGGGSIDHNQKTTAYTSWFANYPAFDFSLASGSAGIGGGVMDSAPLIDIRGVARSAPYDVGAYEFANPTAYQQWLAENDLPTDGSGDGAPGANPSGDGVSNEMKFALGLAVDSQGYAGRVSTGAVTVDGDDYLTLSFTRPEPSPAGVSYEVTASRDLGDWSGSGLIEVSSTASGGLRTTTVRDSIALDAGAAARFLRLEVTR